MKRNSPRKSVALQPRKKSTSGMAAMFLIAGLLISTPFLLAAKDKKDKKDKNKTPGSAAAVNGLPVQALTEDEAIMQALNRLGFGPKPGDIDRVKQMGLQKWIDQQLHPESISDSALEARLERFPTLKMSSSKLLDEFPQPKVAAKREGISAEEYRKEQQEQAKATQQSMQTDMEQADPHHLPNFDDGSSRQRQHGSQRESHKREGRRQGPGRLRQSNVQL